MTLTELNATTDAAIAAAGIISREWGDHGYRIVGAESPTRGGIRFHVRHTDGSEFAVEVDRWGNRIPEGATWNAERSEWVVTSTILTMPNSEDEP